MKMDLFQLGDFTLHSGMRAAWKIDADALSDSDLETLAWIIAQKAPWIRAVEGVPRGGLRLATALQPYTHKGTGSLVIVDDVYMTGGSMEAHRAGREAFGVVLFARQPVIQPWIHALFTLDPADWRE